MHRVELFHSCHWHAFTRNQRAYQAGRLLIDIHDLACVGVICGDDNQGVSILQEIKCYLHGLVERQGFTNLLAGRCQLRAFVIKTESTNVSSG